MKPAVLVVTRHPLQMIASDMKRRAITAEEAVTSFENSTEALNASLSIVERKYSTLRVTYEDFIADIDGQMRRMWDFLGPPYDAQVSAAIAKSAYSTPDLPSQMFPELQDYVSRIQAVSEAHDIFAPYQNAG